MWKTIEAERPPATADERPGKLARRPSPAAAAGGCRLLEGEGIESWVVDPASVAVYRRMRRAKSDGIDGETLLRTLLDFKRGEPRVSSMVRLPRIEEEDRRRVTRERQRLLRERIEHTNRIKGLLMSQGIRDGARLPASCSFSLGRASDL